MTGAWQSICIRLGDALLGWVLWCPRDVAIVLLGAVLALILLAVRRTTTDQERLRQIAADERRLRELIRGARATSDHERLARHQRVRRLVSGQRARAEWLGVCASLIVLSAIAPWGRRRLEYLPAREGESVGFVARFPSSSVGEVAHVVPQEGATVEKGWVRIIGPAVKSGAPCGEAKWLFRFAAAESPYLLTLRNRTQSVAHPIVVGSTIYELPIRRHDDGTETEVMLTPYRPLGLLPPRLPPGFPSWALFLTLVTGIAYLGVRWRRRA